MHHYFSLAMDILGLGAVVVGVVVLAYVIVDIVKGGDE